MFVTYGIGFSIIWVLLFVFCTNSKLKDKPLGAINIQDPADAGVDDGQSDGDTPNNTPPT